jgi:hypothetical protein
MVAAEELDYSKSFDPIQPSAWLILGRFAIKTNHLAAQFISW